MKNNIHKHPLILTSVGIVAVLAVGSIIYYRMSETLPPYHFVQAQYGSLSQTVSATGVVTASQSPELSFVAGGRLAYLSVDVGSHVYAGQLLAELDNADLQSQLGQAQADLQTQQAKLDLLKAGPRPVDIQVKQTGLDSARQELTNMYSSAADTLNTAASSADDAVHGQTDLLLTNPNGDAPTLSFSTTDSQAGINVTNTRITVNKELDTWQGELRLLTGAPAAVEAELSASVQHLSVVRDYLTNLLNALQSAVPNNAFSSASIASSRAAVSGARQSLNATIAGLNTALQKIAAQKLSIASAQAQLAVLMAGATSQDIEAQAAQVARAQAAVALVQAQLSKTVIRASFSGVIARVGPQKGDIVQPNTSVISINPDEPLQLEVSVAEADVGKLGVGDGAVVTLDAYGPQTFTASTTAIDESPTMLNGVPSYKVKLEFTGSETAVKAGMTANVTITSASEDHVLLIPKSAVIRRGGDTLVLIDTATGPVERTVQLGIQGSTEAEVRSGLTSGDRVADFGN